MRKVLFGLIGLVCVVGSSCTVFKKSISFGDTSGARIEASVVEPYDKIITKDAVTIRGLFYVHQVGTRYYFEIPDSLLQREILVVSRFIKTPAGADYYGGDEIGKRTITFEKGPDNKMFLRVSTMISIASEEDAISKAVVNSNIAPILEAFEIEAVNERARSSVINVTSFISGESSLLSLSDEQKDKYDLSSLERDKSYIKSVDSYPVNIEIRSVKTFKAKGKKNDLPAAKLAGAVTVEINNSLVLLPKVPMRKRYYDARVGYFASSYWEYGDEQQRVSRNACIHRWRLEPKEEDMKKWRDGLLVEPRKPIVFYIDPATPEKWRPYLIQGINDWQKAFEQAGFKNAIIGKEWPDSAGMSLEDARFSVLRYFASPERNAYGPSIVDPRSGEIMESHIGWYHNVMDLLHNWYMVQAGAADPRARTMHFDDKLMGELIRFVSSHEVGHALGLRHNMGASYATPVEKLRDKEWLEKYGHTSSIMDYARFNYVAQPEDSVSFAGLTPRIGDYDKWAIQWGYMLFPEETTAAVEKKVLNQMVMDSVSTNPRLWFGGEGRNHDPRAQSEDLGDNAMLASFYGIRNLQTIIPQLEEWTRESSSDDYDNLERVYQDVVRQYYKYLFHVVKHIGGIQVTPKSVSEEGDVYEPVSKERQKEALAFLNKYVFHEPRWLLHGDILNKIQSPHTKNSLVQSMERVMATLLGGVTISRMEFISDRFESSDPYLPEEFIGDVSDLVWKELEVNGTITPYRRSLQKAYVANMITLYNPSDPKGGLMEFFLAKASEKFTSNTDVRPIALNNLMGLHREIGRSIPLTIDHMTRAHLQYVLHEIEEAVGDDHYIEEGYPIRPITID